MSTILKPVRLKSDLVNKIQNLAKSDNRNFNNCVETILIKFFRDNPDIKNITL